MTTEFDLQKLLSPTRQSDFLQKYWEKRPLLITRSDREYFAELLSVDVLDEVITTHDLTYNDVRVVNANYGIDPKEFTTDQKLVDPVKLLGRFERGDSIVFRHLHTRLPKLQAMCTAIEKIFRAQQVQTNIYLSPPASQSFKPHFDTHDVFIAQVWGEKQWELYGSFVEYPIHALGLDQVVPDPGPSKHDFTLRAGDLLYVPRGYVHKAKTSNDFSLQVTVGLITYTWTDLLFAALTEVCRNHAKFRESLPPLGNRERDQVPAELKLAFSKLVDYFAKNADVDRAYNAIVTDFVTSRRVSIRGRLSEYVWAHDQKMASLKYRVRPALAFDLVVKEDKVQLNSPNRTTTLPSNATALLMKALSGEVFTVASLSADFDEGSKQMLIKRLLTEGLIEIVRESIPDRDGPGSGPVIGGSRALDAAAIFR
jgi:bifunctional lysine-specific demethylase and histidyl-hydroxylase MINA